MARTSWGDAPAKVPLFGREADGEFLDDALANGAGALAITGAGGLGKSTLARVWAEAHCDSFDQIIWIGFKHRPELVQVLHSCRQFAFPEALVPTLPLSREVEEVVAMLSTRRVILILDNLEKVMDPSAIGSFEPEYAVLETLCNRVVEADRAGVLLLTSREVPTVVTSLSKQTQRLAHRPLIGLRDIAARRRFLTARGFENLDASDIQAFADHHDGNPYAMGLAIDYIAQDFKAGGLKGYVRSGCPLPGGVTELLDAQYDRLSPVERLCLARYAVERVPLHTKDLVDAFAFRYSAADVTAAFAGLRARSLLEPPTDDGSSLQNLLLEFMTDRVVADLVEALDPSGGSAADEVLVAVPVLNPRSPAHVRAAQERTIVEPVVKALELRSAGAAATRERLESLLDAMKGRPPREVGYAAGTVVNLLLRVGVRLAGHSLCRLPLWSCDFSSADLHNVDMSGCDLQGSAFRSVRGAVTSVCFDDEGLRLYAGTTDGLLHSWETGTWEHRSTRAHEGFVRGVAYDHPGNRVVSVGDDRSVRGWDPVSLRGLPPIGRADEPLRCVAVDWSSGAVAWGGENGLVEFRLDARTETVPIDGHSGTVRSLLFADGGHLLSVGEDGLIIDTKVDYPAPLTRWRSLGEPLWTLTALGDARVVVAGQSGTPIVLDADLEPDDRPLPPLGVPIWQLAVAEQRLLATTSAGALVLYNVDGRAIDRMIPLHQTWARALAVHVGRGLVATGGEDHDIHVLRTSDWTPRRSLLGTSQTLWAVCALSDDVIIAGGSDGLLHVWEDTVKRTVDLGGTRKWIRALAISPDGETVAAAGDAGEILLWNSISGAIRRLGRHPEGQIWSLDFNPHQPLLASAGEDGTVRMWHTDASAESEIVLHEHASWVVSVRFDATGTLIASGADDGRILVSSTDGTHSTWLAAEGSQQPWALAWEGRRIFAGGRDRHIRVWALDDPAEPEATIDWGAAVWSFAIDGQSLFVTGDGGKVSELRLTDLSRSTPDRRVGTARNHDLCLTADRSEFLTVGDEGVVHKAQRDGDAIVRLAPDRQYEGLRLTSAVGLTPEDIASLLHLGATLDPPHMDVAPPSSDLEQTPAPIPASAAEPQEPIPAPDPVDRPARHALVVILLLAILMVTAVIAAGLFLVVLK